MRLVKIAAVLFDIGTHRERFATCCCIIATARWGFSRYWLIAVLTGLWLAPLYGADSVNKTVPGAETKATTQPVRLSALPQGARIAMLGDSITAQLKYSRIIETYLVACAGRKDLSFCTYGWSGGTMGQLLSSMCSDISFFKPSVVTLAFGMNDGHYVPIADWTRPYYTDGLQKSIQSLRAEGVSTIVVGSPGAVDTKFIVPPHGSAEVQLYQGATDYGVIYNSTLRALTDMGRTIAAESQCPFVDLHLPLVETMKRAKAALGDTYDVCGTDGCVIRGPMAG